MRFHSIRSKILWVSGLMILCGFAAVIALHTYTAFRDAKQQQLQQLLAVFGFAQEERGNAFVQTRFVRVHWTGGWLREKGLSATGAQRAPDVPAAEA